MNDAQFSELLKHIDKLGDHVSDIALSTLLAAFFLFVAIMTNSWTQK